MQLGKGENDSCGQVQDYDRGRNEVEVSKAVFEKVEITLPVING